MRALAVLGLVGSLLATGCMAQGTVGGGGRGGIRLSGPGPTILGGALLAGAGGAVIYGVDTSNGNSEQTKHLFDWIGGGMIVVGLAAVIYGIFELSQEPAPPTVGPLPNTPPPPPPPSAPPGA